MNTTEAPKKVLTDAGAKRAEFFRVPLDQLNVLPDFNPRENSKDYRDHIEFLKNSMIAEKESGARTGWKDSHPAEVIALDGKVFVSNGHSRLLAAMATPAGTVPDVPCVAKPAGTTMEELTVGLYTTNSGKPLSTLGQSEVVQRLVEDFGNSSSDVATKLQMSEKYVGQLLLLAEAPDELKQMIVDGKVSASLVIQTLLKNPDGALEELKEGLEQAESQGKSKVTAKTTKTAEQKASAMRKKLADKMFAAVTKLIDNPPEGINPELEEEISGYLYAVERTFAGETVAL